MAQTPSSIDRPCAILDINAINDFDAIHGIAVAGTTFPAPVVV